MRNPVLLIAAAVNRLARITGQQSAAAPSATPRPTGSRQVCSPKCRPDDCRVEKPEANAVNAQRQASAAGWDIWPEGEPAAE